jgi:hypothetical protein
MARHAHSFWLDDTAPEQRELQHWLQALAQDREKNATIVRALLAWYRGAAGISLRDKLDRLLSLTQTLRPVPNNPQPKTQTTPDGITHLDRLGL